MMTLSTPIKTIPPVTGIQYLRCLRENGRARSLDTAFVYHIRRGDDRRRAGDAVRRPVTPRPARGSSRRPRARPSGRSGPRRAAAFEWREPWGSGAGTRARIASSYGNVLVVIETR